MRITSPKNIPLRNNQIKSINNQQNIQRLNQKVSNQKGGAQSYHTSRHSSRMDCNEEYGLKDKLSIATQQISIRSNRSKSKSGISMSRDKTIKIDNIYEPQHFGQSCKNSQNYSTKSVTQNSKNAKSTSRITRATSPTITHFGQFKEDLSRKLIPTISLKQLSQPSNDFDFKELKKEINNLNSSIERENLKNSNQNEQYYFHGQTYRTKQVQKQYFQPVGNNGLIEKNIQLIPSQTLISQYNINHKIHGMGSKKHIESARVNKDRDFKNEYQMGNYLNERRVGQRIGREDVLQKMERAIQKGGSEWGSNAFEYQLNVYGYNETRNESERERTVRDSGERKQGLRMSSKSKLNWKDVIRN